MEYPLKTLNDHFFYNYNIAKALQQLLCIRDRKIISVWFDKLMEMDKTMEQILIRSDYMWFILLMLQSKHIRDPFITLPPPILAPLKTFVPLHIYEDVLIFNKPHAMFVTPRPSEDSIFFS